MKNHIIKISANVLFIFTFLTAFSLTSFGQTPNDLDSNFFGERLSFYSDSNVASLLFKDRNVFSTRRLPNDGQAGGLDLTYKGGVLRADGFSLGSGPSPNNNSIYAIAVQSDGKHIIAGGFRAVNGTGRNYIARVNANGTLDESFDSGIGFSSLIHTVAIQPDGKILVGGTFSTFTDSSGITTKKHIARLNTNGTLDTTFGVNGGANSHVQSLALYPDGKIIISGIFTSFDGISRNRIARLNNDGSLDLSFDTGTGVSTGGVINEVAIQPNGKIYVVGGFTTFNTVARKNIVRLNSDGSVDTTFDPGTSSNSPIESLALQSNGKIIIGGTFSTYNGGEARFIARVNPDGTKDDFLEGTPCPSSPCPANYPYLNLGSYPTRISVTGDGKVYVSAKGKISSSVTNSYFYGIFRFNTDGSPDSTFVRFAPLEGDLNPATGVHALQSDGKIVTNLGRRIASNLDFQSGMVRVNTDGTFDNSYAPIVGTYITIIHDLLMQPDGKLLAVGQFNTVGTTTRIGIARFNLDGTLDTAYTTRTNGNPFKILRQTNSKIIILGGFNQVNGVARSGVARLNADGSLDTTFNPQSGSGGGSVLTAALQSDGKIIIGGNFTVYNGVNRNGIARINADGSLDPTFNPGTGVQFSDSLRDGIKTIVIQSDGKILIGGKFNSYNSITRLGMARLNADGTLDATFNTQLAVTPSVNDIHVFFDGKLLIGGTFSSVNSISRGYIARLNADGTLDSTFGTNTSSPNGTVSRVYIQSNGKIIIGGRFSIVAGQNRRGIARINSDGTLDITFGNNTLGANPFGATNTAWSDLTGLAVDEANGKIYYGGEFSTFNNVGRGSLASLYQNNAQINVTFQTSPVGRSFTVDGITYDSMQTFNWESGSTHTISTTSPQAGNVGTRYLWANWSDGGAISRTISPTVNTAYTANFTTQYQLTMNAGTGGTVSPASGFYDAGQSVPITATANSGFTFANWTGTGNGSYSGTNNPASVTMNAPISQTANFNTQCNYSLNPTSANIASSGGSGSFAVSAPGGCAWTASSNVNWIQVNSGSGSGNGTVNFTVFAHNPFEPARTGTVTVGGQTFTVNQAGTCQWIFNPGVLSVTAAASTQTVSVGTQAGCDFTPFLSNQTPWITNLVSDINNQTITFQVAANGGAQRTGSIVIGAASINIRQSAFDAPNDQPILFFSTRNGSSDVYKMNADGSNQQRLTNAPESESGAVWTPDGTKILYTKSISATQAQFWRMNADGSNKELLFELTGSLSVWGWSPNRQKLLYARREANFVENLWSINTDGTNNIQLTNQGKADHIASWSPNSSKIAFGRCTADAQLDDCDIFTMNADGTNQTNLTPTNPLDDDGANWTPDGTKIVYGGQITVNDYNVFIMNADGTNRLQLTNAAPPAFYTPARVAPNGSKVAMSYRSGTGTQADISTINSDGSNLQNLTNSSVFNNFNIWSPDSAKIAFNSRRDVPNGDLYTMNADGSGVARLTADSATEGITDWFRPAVRRAPFDFDGDGKADISVFRPDNGAWYLLQSQNGFAGISFGFVSDKLVPADYDGDGKNDVAVFRPSNGYWYLLRSTGGFIGIPFGDANDIPVPADYDGDGKAELAVFRPSNGYWYSLNLTTNQFTATLFGISTDKPVPADYDGDGKTDIAVNRNGNWYIQRSQLGFTGVLFGDANDKLVPADYDGDGRADIAVFRPSNGTWYLLQSQAGFTGIAFGLGTDTPAAADYDGDGRADIAVVRNGNWYLNRTTQGFTGILFGTSTDKPIPSAFVR